MIPCGAFLDGFFGQSACNDFLMGCSQYFLCTLRTPDGLHGPLRSGGSINAKTLNSMLSAWPGRGSAPTLAMVEMCFILMRHLGAKALRLMDGGMGSYLHVSPELCLQAERCCCRIFLRTRTIQQRHLAPATKMFGSFGPQSGAGSAWASQHH